MRFTDRMRSLLGLSTGPKTIAQTFQDMKAESFGAAAYAAGRPSQYRRTRTQIDGWTADANFRESQYYDIRAYVRDMDRNDAIVGQLLDRAVDNVVRDGFRLNPQTGDRGLDIEIRDRWDEWAANPAACDLTERHSFQRMERLVLRSVLLDGDCFALPLATGHLQLLEADRVTSPSNPNTNVILGVELDNRGRPDQYWITQIQQDQRMRVGKYVPLDPSAYDRRPARGADGEPLVLHVYNPSRISQTRGITAFHAIFDVLGQIEDLNFATLVRAQVSSCIALFINRQSDFQFGSRTTETAADGTTETVEELSPGLIMRGRPGESISSFQPNVASNDYIEHVKMMLRLVGVQLGMPLTLTLLDTSNTTFHGYRGELQQARLGFSVIQSWLSQRFHSPVYRWKMREWFPDRVARDERNTLRHRWEMPGWLYVDPTKDVAADKEQLNHGLNSPRRIVAQRGHDWQQLVRETVEDRSYAIRLAIAEAKDVNAETGERVSWREMLHLSPPSGVSMGASVELIGVDHDADIGDAEVEEVADADTGA